MADKRKQIILKEILSLIDSVKEHADDLEWDNHIPQIELEYISSKIAKLYEKSIVLNFLNTFEDEFVAAKSQTVMQHLNMQQAIKREVVEEIKDEENVVNVDIPHSKTESLHVKESVEEIINEQPVLIEHEIKETIVPVISEDDNKGAAEAIQVIEEKIEISTKDLTPQQSNSEGGAGVFNKIIDPKRPPISNLKSAIGINQRLQFINNLFKGNADLMNQSIDELNNLASGNEALQKLEEITQKMGWDKEYELYKGFKELVERRYS